MSLMAAVTLAGRDGLKHSATRSAVISTSAHLETSVFGHLLDRDHQPRFLSSQCLLAARTACSAHRRVPLASSPYSAAYGRDA